MDRLDLDDVDDELDIPARKRQLTSSEQKQCEQGIDAEREEGDG